MQRFSFDVVVFDACALHVDPIDLARFEQDDHDRAAARYPACWSWPVPEETVARADAIQALPLDDQWDAAMGLTKDWQAGRCAICAAACHNALVWDHDHATGLVRGRLCTACNAIEGTREGDPLYDRYRQRPPMVILCVEAQYVSPFTGPAEPKLLPDQRTLRSGVNRLSMPAAKPWRS